MDRDNNNESDEVDCKPNVTADEAKEVLEKFYGFKGGPIRQLPGYDDLNFFFLPNTSNNPFVRYLWPHGYVLKIMNSLDSKNDKFCEGQNDILLFLRKHDIPCPVPVKTVFGRHYFKEKFPSAPTAKAIQKEHIVRLYEFQPGVIFKDAPKSYRLFYQLGVFAGDLTEALKKFSHPVFKTHYSIWHLKSATEIKRFSYVVETEKKRELIEEITEGFKRDILMKFDSFEKGMIHGDLNENNIVLEKTGTGEWKISALIDFGDSHESCFMFELAIMACYMMFECRRHNLDPLVGAGHLFAGYMTRRPSFVLECDLLKLSICMRICQSLVLGLRAYELQPGNEYVLESQEMGWPLLEELWETSNEKGAGLVVMNTFFQHRDVHKYTWYRDALGQKSVIDFIIVPRGMRRTVCDVRVKRGAELSTYNHPVLCELDVDETEAPSTNA